MWKCPKCETINNTEQCSVCGARRPEGANVPQEPAYSPQREPYAYQREEIRHRYREDAYVERERREKKNNGLIITIVICVTFIVALLLALGAYIFMQGDEMQDVDITPTNEVGSVYSSVPPKVPEGGIIGGTEWEKNGRAGKTDSRADSDTETGVYTNSETDADSQTGLFKRAERVL